MKKTPKVIIYNGNYCYKSIVPYKYSTKPFYGYKGKYWYYKYDDKTGNFEKTSLFECVELSEWLIEKDMQAMLEHFEIEY